MPSSSRHPRRPSRAQPGAHGDAMSESKAIVLIDSKPLQNAAWTEYHTLRKRLDKLSRDLHRHEATDQPSYQAWLHSTFPVLVTQLRELHEEVATKARQVQNVQMMGAMTGRSLKKLWREQKAQAGRPDEQQDDDDGFFDDEEEDEDPFFKDDDASSKRSSRRDDDEAAPRSPAKKQSPASPAAREIYRRLVQRLHPDRGAAWTTALQQLWHEVQQAWAARDADWLSRLEMEWENAHEAVGPSSSVSRLRRAIQDLHAARRDTERKLRTYRSAVEWRFTLNEKKRAELSRRTEGNFDHDIALLQQQLTYLNNTISAWEKEPETRRPRPRRYFR